VAATVGRPLSWLAELVRNVLLFIDPEMCGRGLRGEHVAWVRLAVQ
jgi:hypothetical protein